MKTNSQHVGFCSVLLLLLPCFLFTATSAELQPEMRSCLDDLEHPSFSKRQAACQKLAEAGPSLFPALSEAAIQGDRETTLRIVGLLKQSLRSKDEAEKLAARKSLDQIGASTNTAAARAAREAIKDVENPERITPDQQVMINGFMRRQNGFRPGQLPQGFPGMPAALPALPVWQPGNAPRTTRTTFLPDGSIQLIAQDADADVKIEKDAAGRIKVEVTRRKDGKVITMKSEAANEAELKAKSPEAFKHYEKHAATFQRRNPIVPAAQQLNPPDIEQIRKNADERMDRIMQDMIDRAPTPAHAESLRKAWDQMKASRQNRAGIPLGQLP